MITVGVNGYGTIGKRVAAAVQAQPDMTLAGVAKTRPNHEAAYAIDHDIPLYAAIEERADQFDEADLPITGPVEDLVADADVIVDATPSGVGAANKPLYEAHDTPAIYQGGEPAGLVDTSFNARANYHDANDATFVRVVSCNTTGLTRAIAPLREAYEIEKVRATLIRRGGDPTQSDRGPINDILPNPVALPSHHGPDVNSIFPDLVIDTLAVKVPSTLMHLHSINLALTEPPDPADVRDLLAAESRIFLVTPDLAIAGTAELKEYALDRGRPRGDLWENAIWAESIGTADTDLYLFQAIHQESNVVPENIDAIRAITNTTDQATSINTTNTTLGITT